MKWRPNKIILLVATLAFIVIYCGQSAVDSPDDFNSEPSANTLMKDMGVEFTGNENHAITLELAKQLTDAFQKDNPLDSYAWYFGKRDRCPWYHR